MEDTGPLIGMRIKLKRLQDRVEEALDLLKKDDPDIELVIKILEGEETEEEV